MEDVFPDGCTLRLGDGAEELTLGVATKREESPLLIRAMQGEHDLKAVSEDEVSYENPQSWMRQELALYRGI